MSRVGNKPIPMPKGVTLQVGQSQVGKEVGAEISVKGPKGELKVPLPNGVTIEQDAANVYVKRESEKLKALHGLTRALTSNAMVGVSTGFTTELDIVGTGYRAEVKGNVAIFSLGYSHAIEVFVPKGITCTVDKMTHIIINGHDKQAVGQLAANIRMLRKPDPYKNKGVRYTGEVLRKKAGKAQGK
jgi:large subunit ribosomal protein L6